MSALLPTLFVLFIRLSLFIACRLLLLPLLFGEAAHASLDLTTLDDDEDGAYVPLTSLRGAALPNPVTNRATQGGTFRALRQSISLNASIPGSSTAPRIFFGLLDVHSATALLFAVAFEESAMLFALVLLEAVGLQRGVLVVNWGFSLMSTLALAVLLIPLSICMLLTFRVEGASTPTRRLLWTSLPFILWLALFLRVPLPSAMAAQTTHYLDAALARTAVLGVSLIALLSGSAAAGAASDTYEAFFAKNKVKPPTPSDLRAATESFQRARSDLGARREALAALRARPVDAADQPGFFGRMWSGSQRDKEAASLTQEITGLEMLARAMRDDLDRLRVARREAEWAKTLHGRVLLGAGHVFSVYCVWRVLLALLSLILLGYRDKAPSDFVSIGLAHITRLLGVQLDLAALSRQINLIFVGALIVIRMRSVLGGLGAFFRAASAGVSTGFLIIFLAEVLAIYLLATLIQLRTALPPSFSTIPGEDPKTTHPPLLSTLPSFAAFGAILDAGFLLAALATGVQRWMTRETEPTLFGGRR